jgi:hypothetical protein
MRRLRRTVNDSVQFVLGEKSEDFFAISDINVEVLEAARRLQKPVAVPRRVTLLTEKNRPHIVVDADNIMSLPVKKRYRFRTYQPA